MTVRRASRLAALVGACMGSACAGHTAVAPALGPVAGAPRNDLHWFRASAEYRGIAVETYLAAAARLPDLVGGTATGGWAVILDADETVLDNSLNERRLADRGERFSEIQWARWVREGAATAVPGAVDFTRQVHALGGRIAIVTNRADSLCAPTRDNLRKIGVEADIVLCQPGKQSDKNPRFLAVQNGTAAPGLRPLKVVEWIGDNIQDFPALTQDIRHLADGYANFGIRYFLLPNPMYGSWERNPEP